MKRLPVEEAVGQVLAHDMTRIVPGEYKGPAFRKGHILQPEDIPLLRRMGKNHVYVAELNEGMVHEDDAAVRIASAAAGEGVSLSQPSEGRVNLVAQSSGLLQVDLTRLLSVNNDDTVIFSTLHRNTPVRQGQVVAGTRVIPLTVQEETVASAENTLKGRSPMISVRPFQALKAAIVVTGSEVFTGMIEDRFGPVLASKVGPYGGHLMDLRYAPDDADAIAERIRSCIDDGAELVMVSGGMSVDPDDVTPLAIRRVADDVIRYGAPVLPGAMFMVARRGNVTILGVPGCGMYRKVTILDIVLPRIFARIPVTREDIIELCHGGLCLGCEECRYPVCPYGKV